MWCEAGQQAEAFWRQTPKLASRVIRAFRKRQEQDGRDMLTAAWLSGAVAQCDLKKFPLSKLLGEKKDPEPKRQTPEQILAVLDSLGPTKIRSS